MADDSVKALRGVYDKGTMLSGEDFEQMMDYVQEEIFADAYAGINAFGAGADRFTSAVNEKMEQLYLGRYRSQENGVRETNGPPASAQKNTAGYGGERYSADDTVSAYDYTKTFAEQLSDYRNGAFPQKDTFLLGRTPDVLTNIGLAALPLTMDRKHVDYALNGSYKGDAERVKDHFLPESELVKIPDLIADPVAIIQDRQLWQKKPTAFSVDVLVEMDINGKKTLVPINVNSKGYINGREIDSNRVQTVHGNVDTVQRFIDALNSDSDSNVTVYYVNKEKATKFLRPAGHLISRTAKNLDGYIHSVTDAGSPVKMRINSVEESQQFKRWFGDWQNHPENASKVVNEDGTPKVVYHGTNKNFTVFKSKDGCYWFSGSEDYAESMAEERGSDTVMQAYLNMRRPYKTKLPPGQFSDPGYEAPIIRAAKAGNYDGVIIEVDTDNELEMDTFYVVFDPTQIKSATDNIGTFDGTNPDIRYSVDDESDETDYASVQAAMSTQGEAWSEMYLRDQLDDGAEMIATDNQGRQLSQGQAEYFKDSQARDENGNLVTVYHSSPTAGFYQFDGRNGNGHYRFSKYGKTVTFFTDKKAMADTYTADNKRFDTTRNGRFKDGLQDLKRKVTGQPAPSYSGQYEGYTNITKPYVVDAEGRNWDDVRTVFDQEKYDSLMSITPEEKAAVMSLWEMAGQNQDWFCAICNMFDIRASRTQLKDTSQRHG